MREKIRQAWHELDWGAGFRLFAVSYYAWPPLAWKVSRAMPARLGIVRWSNPLTNYVLLLVGVVIVWLSVAALIHGDWFIGAILASVALMHFGVIAVRLHMPYRAYRLQRSEHHGSVA